MTGKSILLLVGGLVIGAGTGATGYVSIEPVFSGLFQGALVLFLLDLGVMAGHRLRDLPQAGPGLVVAALLLPVVNGSLGVLLGAAAGLSVGGATLLGVLAGSASYIAAPAAVRLALPEANPAYYLTSQPRDHVPVQPGVRDPALPRARRRRDLRRSACMDGMTRRLVALPAAALLLTLAGCGASSSPVAVDQPTPAPSVSEVSPAPTSVASGVPQDTADQTINVTVAGGKVSGPDWAGCRQAR